MSRITITTRADPLQLQQCMKQIKRLVNVIKLRDMTGEESVKREMALICVRAAPGNKDRLDEIIAGFNGRVVDKSPQYYTFEVTGNQDAIDELLVLVEPFGIKKLARSGVLALYKETE
jgi:acetolactate synthase-1/3 small subunit